MLHTWWGIASPLRRSQAWRHRYGFGKRCVSVIFCTHGEKAPSASVASASMARPWRRSPAWRHRYGLAKSCVNICCTHGEKAPSASTTSGPMARPWRRSPAWRHRVWLRWMLCWYSMLHTWWGKSTLGLYDLGPNGEAMERITSMTSQVWLS